MTAHKLSMADEAVITALITKQAELETEIEYLHNKIVSMKTGPHADLLKENRNLRHELAVLVHGVDVESERLREQLAASQAECEEQARLNGMGAEREATLLARLQESQAREAKLREALDRIANDDNVTCLESDQMDRCMWVADRALALPHDDTALSEYRCRVLLEAANKLSNDWRYAHGDPADAIRRMAEE